MAMEILGEGEKANLIEDAMSGKPACTSRTGDGR